MSLFLLLFPLQMVEEESHYFDTVFSSKKKKHVLCSSLCFHFCCGDPPNMYSFFSWFDLTSFPPHLSLFLSFLNPLDYTLLHLYLSFFFFIFFYIFYLVFIWVLREKTKSKICCVHGNWSEWWSNWSWEQE
jgi:hypothetical protein